MRKCTRNAHSLLRRAAPPTLHVRACKAGGWLTLRACQVAWGGGATLASRIEKRYIVYMRCPSTSVLDEEMHARYSGVPRHLHCLHVRACKAGGWLTLRAC